MGFPDTPCGKWIGIRDVNGLIPIRVHGGLRTRIEIVNEKMELKLVSFMGPVWVQIKNDMKKLNF